jgi:hypothetical protein
MNKCFSDYELTCRVENELRNTSESNPGDLWKILSKFKRSKREDKIDIDELYEYLKNLNLSNEVGDSNFEMPNTNDNLANDTLNGKIIEEEITSIIQNLKNGKAPGYDCVINEYIKSTISLCMTLYLKLLRKIIDTGIIIPEIWTIGIIIPEIWTIGIIIPEIWTIGIIIPEMWTIGKIIP